jgi:hypothetical protein
MTALEGWENFYIIVGPSAGALIGLQFVVITLIAGHPVDKSDEQAGDAFTTPSVVHFGVVLLLSAVISAPWSGIGPIAVTYGVVGIIGIAYVITVARRMRSQTAYKPVFEDWLFHVLLPIVGYTMLASSAYTAISHLRSALFIAAGAALLLLFIGIHNAWDTVTHLVFVRKVGQENEEEDN